VLPPWHHLGVHVFLIGGVNAPSDSPAYARECLLFTEQATQLGRALACAGHTLLVCSPFPGSLDHAALAGASNAATALRPASVELHYLDLPSVRAAVDALRTTYPNTKISAFHYPPTPDAMARPDDAEARRVAWLLPQIRAMDRAFLTLALGGRAEGAASLLLHLAVARRRALVPLPFLGGTAARTFELQRDELAAQWGTDFSLLEDPAQLEQVVAKLEEVFADNRTGSRETSTDRPLRFFISYARARAAEADFVEALLRRQTELTVQVIRDDTEFEAGYEIDAQIRAKLFEADVFVGLWCAEYACSPWCADELEVALERVSAGLRLWLLVLDDTRMVPRQARRLQFISARTRDELESKVLAQLSTLLKARGSITLNSKKKRRPNRRK
jgi:hypothetical protein